MHVLSYCTKLPNSFKFRFIKLFNFCDQILLIRNFSFRFLLNFFLHVLSALAYCQFFTVIDDVIKLETEGIYIEKLGKNVRGSIAFISADNLGKHSLSGFPESFGPAVKRLCHVCLAPTAELNFKYADQFEVRTAENYNRQADLVEQNLATPATYGIKFNSPFNRLKYGHIVTMLPPDLTHDLCEGIIPNVLTHALKYFIREKKYFSLQFLKFKLKNFHFGSQDKRNLFDFIPNDFDKRAGGIGGNATKNLYLLRFLLFFVGNKIPADDCVLNLIQHLFDIVQIVLAECIPNSMILYCKKIKLGEIKMLDSASF